MIFKAQGMNWVALTKLREDYVVKCGSVFRFPSAYPYEEYVDYLLCSSDRVFFVVLTGYKGGKIWDIDVAAKESGRLTAGWFVKNWKKYIYPDCEPEDVFYCDGLPVPEYPIHLRLRSLLDRAQGQ